ncbi:phosphomannomutase/phosphoglucomutase [Candidatus Schmidhempelia bombi]|uniref:phosphomannomutase n=1 Tax=Candidatus Schmidhempelia bombi str. Bimp TaxID=1387197 RepID=A0AB94IAV7_9GAMM|nr:phosphomannomutase/phosphoglucomutase [Candidatus Schmidhempelia bombi]TEA26538.1 phosphomannomutase/phosphoglucomutase [Candidatus Schmidhempelia bombi str. Bimp]
MSINKAQLHCFKAYDIRGKLGEELNEDIAYRIGRAYAQYFRPHQVAIGSDVRLTSESLKKAVTQGLLDCGVNVIDIGLSGTEEIYFTTFYYQLDGGIEITASHNPIDYNGMKLVSQHAKPIDSQQLLAIKRLAEANDVMPALPEKKGQYKQLNIIHDYVTHLLNYINFQNIKRPLKLVINSGNGAAGHVIDAIEKQFKLANLPIEIIKVHHEPNGHFPHGIPNPLLPECRDDTRQAVIEHKADMGIAFDGDFDRCFFFDEQGNFIEGYYIVGLLAESFLLKYPGANIIHDPRLIWNTIDIVKKQGGQAIQSKTGHAFIKQSMREHDAVYGGEMSAHHYFKEFAYCDSGMIPWLLVTELLCLKGLPLSQLVKERIHAYPVSGEINRMVTNPQQIINRVKQHFLSHAITVDMTDGLSMHFDHWRFNLRLSNTEPLIRLNVEAIADKDLMQDKTALLLSLFEEKNGNVEQG